MRGPNYLPWRAIECFGRFLAATVQDGGGQGLY